MDSKSVVKVFLACALGFFALGFVLGNRSQVPETKIEYRDKIVYKDKIVYREKASVKDTKLVKPDGTVKEVHEVSKGQEASHEEAAIITQVETKVVEPALDIVGGIGLSDWRLKGLVGVSYKGPGLLIVSDGKVDHAGFLTYTLHY